MRPGTWMEGSGKRAKPTRPSMPRCHRLVKKEISNSKIPAMGETMPMDLKLKIQIKSRTPLRPPSKVQPRPLEPPPWTKASKGLSCWAALELPSKLTYRHGPMLRRQSPRRSHTPLKLITTQALLSLRVGEDLASKARCARMESS